MFGFFCCHDCATSSDINKFLQAYPVRIGLAPDTHKNLVAIPNVNMLKEYQAELEKRKLW